MLMPLMAESYVPAALPYLISADILSRFLTSIHFLHPLGLVPAKLLMLIMEEEACLQAREQNVPLFGEDLRDFLHHRM